jgi:hypothetical protein
VSRGKQREIRETIDFQLVLGQKYEVWLARLSRGTWPEVAPALGFRQKKTQLIRVELFYGLVVGADPGSIPTS